MAEGYERHERYQELAVGHVLGGLDAGAAADFRAHLLGCRDCRMRVAELRDIAAELAAAEREEREHARLRTEAPAPDEPEPVALRRPWTVGVGPLLVAAIVLMGVLGAVGFWNLHLRTAADGYAEVAELRGDVLRELASGVPVNVEAAEGLTAIVVVDGARVAFSVDGLGGLGDGEIVVAWLVATADGDTTPALFARADQLRDGLFAGQTADQGAQQLLVTLERGVPADAPSEEVLVSAVLRALSDDA